MKLVHLVVLTALPLAAALQHAIGRHALMGPSRTGPIQAGILKAMRGNKKIEQEPQIKVGSPLPDVDVRARLYRIRYADGARIQMVFGSTRLSAGRGCAL